MPLEIEQAVDAAPVIVEKAEKVPTLFEKLHEVAVAIDNIEKNGDNTHQHYKYVTEADVKRAVRRELLDRHILVIPSVTPNGVSHLPATGGKGFVTTVEIAYRFIDLDAVAQTATQFQRNDWIPPSELTVTWTGAGSDIGGDKGLYKAYSGALKYMLLTLFLIPTGDDPEGEATTTGAAQGEHVDDRRPSIPPIPLDRAKAILALAVEADLANDAGELKAVLKAKLITVGVETGKIGHLNVDQAEAVEAWLKTEVSNVSAA